LEFKLQLVRVSDTLKRELQPGNMPLLTELGNILWDGFYNDAAPTALKQNRFALAQGFGGKLFQFRISTFLRKDAFPLAVAGL